MRTIESKKLIADLIAAAIIVDTHRSQHGYEEMQRRYLLTERLKGYAKRLLDDPPAAVPGDISALVLPAGAGVDQITLSLPVGDRAALYQQLDLALQWLSRVHCAISETWPVRGINAEEHAGAADDAEGDRQYWGLVKDRPDRPMPPLVDGGSYGLVQGADAL